MKNLIKTRTPPEPLAELNRKLELELKPLNWMLCKTRNLFRPTDPIEARYWTLVTRIG